MGAVPKKKPSKSRIGHRRTAWLRSFQLPAISQCENCQAAKLPHRVCLECGYYRGRKVIEPTTKVRKIQ